MALLPRGQVAQKVEAAAQEESQAKQDAVAGALAGTLGKAQHALTLDAALAGGGTSGPLGINGLPINPGKKLLTW